MFDKLTPHLNLFSYEALFFIFSQFKPIFWGQYLFFYKNKRV